MPSRISTYVEPFLGGGSMFLHVISRYNPSRVVLGDANQEIMNIYAVVKNQLPELLEELRLIEEAYVGLTYEGRKEFYLAVRQEYAFGTITDARAAAFLYFLLSTCFNGQYVVTTNGRFYTSPGELLVKNPINYNQIIGWNRVFLDFKVELFCGDWKDTLTAVEPIEPNTFVFLDPPYRESNLHDNQYMNEFFGEADDMQGSIIDYTRKFPSDSTIFLCNMERDEIGYFVGLGEGLETVKIRRKVTTYSSGEADHFINEILVHNNVENNIRLDAFFE
jgi:DNA adenine methylase